MKTFRHFFQTQRYPKSRFLIVLLNFFVKSFRHFFQTQCYPKSWFFKILHLNFFSPLFSNSTQSKVPVSESSTWIFFVKTFTTQRQHMHSLVSIWQNFVACHSSKQIRRLHTFLGNWNIFFISVPLRSSHYKRQSFVFQGELIKWLHNSGVWRHRSEQQAFYLAISDVTILMQKLTVRK